jgi:hypothetical protein
LIYIHGEERNLGTLFPVVLDNYVPAEHMCNLMDSFVYKLAMADLGFKSARSHLTQSPL